VRPGHFPLEGFNLILDITELRMSRVDLWLVVLCTVRSGSVLSYKNK
jgi:hypothetical protein